MRLRKKQKGQALTEFALILPLLLLLLLGIVEASRVIWAFITVQAAAREAARFAVAGRPFLDTSDNETFLDEALVQQICRGETDEPEAVGPGVQPWVCEIDDRLEAIENVARRRGQTVAVQHVCVGLAEFTGECSTRSGAFGVLVRGQVVSDTITGTVIMIEDDNPGTQGLNVEVSTFYNIKMITPIFDVLMGRNYITLQGRVQMQNEGIDAALGIEPPPAIGTPVIDEDTEFGEGTPQRQIWSVSGYTDIPQSSALKVHLEKHPSTEGPYDIYLDDNAGGQYPICTNVSTDAQGSTAPDPDCDLSVFPVPAGFYDLYSAPFGFTGPRLATAIEQVEVVAGGNPTIVVEDGNIWSANSTTKVRLVAHQSADEPFDVVLYASDGTTVLQSIATSVTTSEGSSGIDWTVPDVSSPACDWDSGTPCLIRSHKSGLTDVYAETEVYINQPEIVLIPSAGPYAEGTTLRFALRGHTPNKRYDIVVHGGSPDPLVVGTTLETNSSGDSPLPVVWTIPDSCFLSGWPNGTYTVTSQPNGSTQVIADTDIEIFTPADPFIVVDGGSTWPAGSLISIEFHNHLTNRIHFAEFDSTRIPTSQVGDTFDTGDCGFATVNYLIPINTAEGSYTIGSFLDETLAGDPPNPQAEFTIQVQETPFIEVVEGNAVLPDQTITIRLNNHVPDFGYGVTYADRELFTVLTDNQGAAEVTYDLKTLPASPGPDFSDPSNLGVPFDMYSQDLVSGQHVATTTLALQGADLVVTSVEFGSNVEIDTVVPVTVTVQNMQPVSITGYFDVDAYFNPSPVPPSYLAGYNFPGDVKFWENFIAANGQPGDTLTFEADMLVQSDDDQIAYGFADTSNFIFEGEAVGEVGNPNNVLDNSSPVSCPGGPCPPPDDVVPDIPPGLTLCTDPLVNQSFETVSPPTWVLNFGSGVVFNTSNAHTGIRKLKAPSDSGDLKPWYYQKFTMPDWIISSTTTIDLNLYKNIDNAGADEPNDEFYAAIVTTPSSNIATALATKITTPTLIANGVMGGGAYDPNDWNQVSVSLPVIDRDTLESYAGQELTLYIYNDNASNFVSCGGGAGCGTRFYFDDVQLSPCTTQPLPDPINTRITGVVTLNFSDGTFEKVPYVKVWAYEVNGNAVYETFTLQNGEFNFYNLPATPAGTEYLIFAQHNVVDPYDPNQIETLAADTSIILKSTNDNNNPAQTFLDLFTLAPQP